MNSVRTPLTKQQRGQQPQQAARSSYYTRPFANLVAYVLNTAVVFSIGVYGLFGLPTNGALSAKYQTLVTPIGWAFAIWSLIFGTQGVWAVVCLFVNNVQIDAVGYKYVLVCLAQIAWSILFALERIPESLGAMVAIWMSLVWIVCSLPATKGFTDVLWQLPFGIHAGWITAATAVNVNVVLQAEGVTASNQFLAAMASLVVLATLALVLAWWQRATGLLIVSVLSWATFGIFMELSNPSQLITETFDDNQITTVRFGAAAVSGLALAAFVVQALRNALSRGGGGGGSISMDDNSTIATRQSYQRFDGPQVQVTGKPINRAQI